MSFTTGPTNGKFCWNRQLNYSAFWKSSCGHGILEALFSHPLSLCKHANTSTFEGYSS
ncbi:hypothetical protein MANES_13G046850v8 [Manihot esculenta]|uniref:Uncharacterized protein n=1 Tax=Manihot esculenta TaxID=3983 RepID=A0ACB7GJ20_MANES|nr:hypothetical protein MANES_13G046850v8 [Manihot esculenta]